jgi:hypothetical protein
LWIRHDETVRYKAAVSVEGHQVIQRAVTAIRLAVGGDAGVVEQRTFGQLGEARPPGGLPGQIMRNPWMATFVLTPSEVDASDLRRAKGLLERLTQLERDFPIATDRFVAIPQRARAEDRLIDATIGLESLLLQGVRDELRYQFALRGALLLGETRDERTGWFGSLREIYDSRSKVVHGAPAKRRRVDQEVAKAAVDALRRALVVVARRRLRPKVLDEQLRDAALGGRMRRNT